MLNIILSEFLPSSIHSLCWMQDTKSGRNVRISRYVLMREHHWIVFSSQIFRLRSSPIHLFYFLICLSAFFSLKNPKNRFPTIDKGFRISEKILEALVWFISSLHIFYSFHRSFSVSKYKNTKKIASDFNLLTFLLVDSTSTCHCSNLKIKL